MAERHEMVLGQLVNELEGRRSSRMGVVGTNRCSSGGTWSPAVTRCWPGSLGLARAAMVEMGMAENLVCGNRDKEKRSAL